MTTYRLFPATNGPTTPVAYSGNFLAGVVFKVTQGGMWFNGYYHWVPGTNGDTVARKFALWNITGVNAGTLISSATVTSGTLTAGQWNFIPLATPIPLAIGTAYNACTGWLAVNGFPDSDISGAGTGAVDSFGTGGHTTGITQGPLFAFSDAINGGTKPEPYGSNQGLFGVGGTDPTVIMPASQSNSGNFWMDVQVSDTGPADYNGSYRLWPNKVDASAGTSVDASVNYEVATEFALSQPCTASKIWYYSPSTATQLATLANIWSITGGGPAGTLVTSVSSPSWSGAAGTGWLSTTLPGGGMVLPAGKYKVGVYNGAATPAGAFAKDAQTDYWRNGAGASGISWPPISAPNLSSASLAYNYNGNAGGTPPFSDGTTLAGQSTFTQGPPDVFPYLVALVPTPTAGSTQNYWVDLEVTPDPLFPAPAPPVAGTQVISRSTGRVIRR